MFEDFEQKKIEEDEDSDSWSYSYPSYTRFTITGKTKSRLGRSNRQKQQPSNKDEIKDNVNLTSEFGSTSSLVPNTPNNCGNWLKTDIFTSGSQFTQPRNVPDPSSVNDSGVDVSFQSNFFYSLKNDSVQNNSNCKRNLAFNNELFKLEEPQKNGKTEQNQLIKLPPISNLKFPFEENKENASEEKPSENFNSKEKISFDPSWSQFKRICDGNIPFAPISNKPVQINESATNARTNFRQTSNEPFNPLNIFNSMSVKENNDHYTPLDLSCGESLTKTFNRSITGGSEHTPVAPEITSSTYPQTQLPQQIIEDPLKTDDIMKQKNYSEDINSILPAFLVPTNKNQFCLADEKLKKSPPISNNTDSDSKIPQSLQSAVSSSVIFHHTLAQSQCVQESNLKGLSNTDSHNLKVQNNSDKPNSINAIDLPTSKSSAIPKPSSEAIDGHSTKDPFKQSDKLCPEPFKFNEPNNFPLPPIDNLFSRRESWIGLHTQSHALVTQFSNLKSREEESKITIENEPNKPNTNVCENIPFAKPQNIIKMESSIKPNDQPQNLVINNINEGHDKNQPKEPFPLISDNIATKHTLSEDKKSPPFQNRLPAERNIPSCYNGPLQKKTEQLMGSQCNEFKSALSSAGISQSAEPQKEEVNQKVYESTQHPPAEAPPIKQPISSEPFIRHNSAQVNSTASQNQVLPNTRQPLAVNHQPDSGQRYQKTYLAPHAPLEQSNIRNFPHVKPGIPQQNRPHLAASKKPQNAFKMPGAQGLLARGNAELYVNDRTFTILSMLGRGGSSEVYQVLDPRSSKLMAVKCVDLSMVDKTIADGYLNEIDLLSKLQGCASVIRMFDYEYVEENKMLYVVMEKGDTDLSQLIRDISKTKKISMSMIIYYWTEMLNAVKDIHEQGIIHSDLKPANFLLVSGRLKLIDFGIASSQGDMTSVVKEVTTGTWNYMSPEAIRNTSSSGKGFKITYKSDVWSLGCILYNLVYGKTPFSHITNTWGKLQAIADANHRIDFPEVGAPVVLAGALRSCFHRDPKQRPTVAELLRLQYHATCDTNHIGRQLLTILHAECWDKVSHLFPDVKSSQEDNNTASGTV